MNELYNINMLLIRTSDNYYNIHLTTNGILHYITYLIPSQKDLEPIKPLIDSEHHTRYLKAYTRLVKKLAKELTQKEIFKSKMIQNGFTISDFDFKKVDVTILAL